MMKSSFLAAAIFLIAATHSYSAAQPGVRWECVGKSHIRSGRGQDVKWCEQKAYELYEGERGVGCCAANYMDDQDVYATWANMRDGLPNHVLKDECPSCYGLAK